MSIRHPIKTGLLAAAAIVSVVTCGSWIGPTPSYGESALDLLSGFDTERLDGCHPVTDSESAGEMARLLYRVRRVDSNVIAERAQPQTGLYEPGDVTTVAGRIAAVRQYKVPESLVEFLDLDVFQEIVLNKDAEGRSRSVFAPPLKGKLSLDDEIFASVIVVRQTEDQDVFAAGAISWTPSDPNNVGWSLLAENGVDLGPVAEAASRNRRPLEAADGDAFYSLLVGAKRVGAEADGDLEALPAAKKVKPTDLLQAPDQYAGQWIQIRASTVRITKITVDDPGRREQLGQNHYFQVDASGDLGKTIVKLKRNDGDPGGPVEMSGSYPLSLVTTTLPDFLQRQFDSQNAVVMMVSHPISVDGFFFRLWSYENEFMTNQNAGKQVGPLIVAASIRSTMPPVNPGDDVRWIGYLMAAGVIIAILGTVGWTRRNAREDEVVRKNASESITIDL